MPLQAARHYNRFSTGRLWLAAAVADADAEGEGEGLDVAKAGVAHHLLHGVAGDEGVDGLGEVFVGPGFVTGNPGGSAGEDFREVEVVEGAENSVRRQREFEDDQAAAGFEDAMEFFQGGGGIGDVADAEGDGEDVGGFICEWETKCITI